jgi:hypothetical protein
VLKDGDVAYALTDLEHYEVAVCKDPAVPLALITDHNPLAKAVVPSVPRGDGKEIIKCTNFGCYVEKGEDWSNADIVPATASQTVDTGGMGKTVKPIKTNDKIGDTSKLDGGIKPEVTPLEGGIKKESPATSGTGGGVRALMNTSQQGSGQTSLITTETEGVNNPLNSDKKQIKRSFSDAAVNKVVGALLAGAGRSVASTVASAVISEDDVEKTMTYRNTPANVEMKYPEEGEEVWDSKQQKQVKEDKTPNRTNQLESKSGYQTEDGNNQLGGQASPEEKLVSALGAQNKETTVNKD